MSVLTNILAAIIKLAFVVTSIYVLFLSIKLMHKGIKALNIYISKNQ